MNIINEITNSQSYITIGLMSIVLILIVVSIIQFVLIKRLDNKHKKFMRGGTGKNIEELVLGYLDKVDNANKLSELTKEKCDKIHEELQGCIQKSAILRYKAFENVGSDLSFSISLLDNNNDGFILTGIYGRNESTTYAKPINKGISRYDLSEEEKEVLEKAVNKKSSI